MADTKLNWLEEVKADAIFNYNQRKRIREEERAHKEAKEAGETQETAKKTEKTSSKKGK